MFLNFIFIGIFFIANFLSAMEDSYQFQRATVEDVKDILELIKKKVILDDDKIVIVPEKFREMNLISTIEKQRLFLAKHKGKIIGLQKLYIIDSQKELDETLKLEIRCHDQEPCAAGVLFCGEGMQYCNIENIRTHYENNDTYIYRGGAFTDPDYRNQRINTQLSDFAFNEIANAVTEHCRAYQSKNLILLYGLVAKNAGDSHDLLGGRSRSNVAQFIRFIKQRYLQIQELQLYRYPARMPQFDPKSEVCVSKQEEDQKLSDFGCVVRYCLNKI